VPAWWCIDSWQRHLLNLLGGGSLGDVMRQELKRLRLAGGLDDPPHAVSARHTRPKRAIVAQRTGEALPGCDRDRTLVRSVHVREDEYRHDPSLIERPSIRYPEIP
jgi:hypothetical protein